MKILILLLFISSLIFPMDTLKTNPNVKLKDTIVVANQGTQKVLVINEPSFLEKYLPLIGTFIGSLLAALIAVISIKITHRNQINIEQKKIRAEKEKANNEYYGLLATTHSILVVHQSVFNSLIKEIKGILDDFKINKRLAYERPFTFISIDLLKKIYSDIILYEHFSTDLNYKLSGYIISIDNLYNDLNFVPLQRLRVEIQNKEEYQKKVEFYFSELLGKIGVIKERVDEICNIILPTDISAPSVDT